MRLLARVTAMLLLAAGCGKNNGDGNAGNAAAGDMGNEDVFVPLDWGDAGPSFDVGPLAETLPLELLGPPGTQQAVELVIDGVADDSEVGLRLRIANLVVEDSAEVVVNGAYTIPLAEPGSEFLRPTGGWAEGVIPLDPRQIRNGENYFQFRWTGESDDIAGFRVIAVELRVDAGGASFDEFDDPSAWAPADPTPEAIERGRRYFQNVSPNGGPVCAECHTRSGADLEYYAYSDRAITAYAELLGFEANEAADLTSYIRSLGVGRDGRPWQAPFQPGPDNYGAAGAAMASVVGDADVRAAWLGDTIPASIEWDHAAGYDPYRVPSGLQAPSWNRWLPRQVDFGWFDRSNGALDDAIGAYEADPSLDSAHGLLQAAVSVGNELSRDGDPAARIDLMRWAAVKLWDWSREQSFYETHHGFPDDAWGTQGQVGSPPYMAEVGFAFFDASGAGDPLAQQQALQWWIAQVSADYGRGRSTGSRPLDYHSLLVASQGIAGPNEIAWFYVLGSWEESKGTLIDLWGAQEGPVRLLPVALPYVPTDLLPLLWRRFVEKESAHAIGGGTFTAEHLSLFQRAWEATCGDLDQNTQEQLVALTPDALRDSIVCP